MAAAGEGGLATCGCWVASPIVMRINTAADQKRKPPGSARSLAGAPASIPIVARDVEPNGASYPLDGAVTERTTRDRVK